MFDMADDGRLLPRAPARRRLAPIRVVIGDSDSARRALVAGILSHQSDVHVVAASRNGKEVVSAIESYRPDVVFLAVQMPEGDAFKVIERMGSRRMPAVVFIATKHDFAARAFDVRALDYLVEPLSRRRVEQAVGRAREHVTHQHLLAAAGRLLAQAPPRDRQDAPVERLAVRTGKCVAFVDTAAIDWIEAEGNYVRLHVGAKSYRVRKTMSDMESALGVQQVARIHRRILVRIARVRELRFNASGRCDAVLEGDVTLPVSRTYRVSLQKRLGRR
jgi:two-component system LytT family response regulator